MRVVRLAQLFESKYSFLSEAATKRDIVNQVKKELINAYNLYVNSNTAKEPVLQMLANVNEPFSQGLVSAIEELIAKLDKVSAPALFHMISQILGSIKQAKEDPKKTVRNFIHDAIRIKRESDKNYREHVKSKFEMVLSRLSSIFEKSVQALQQAIALEGPIEGGAVEPERKELSKEKLLMFMRTPAAQTYGLDDMEVMTKILQYPELRDKLTSLINAIDRGHIPADSLDITYEVRDIKRQFDQKQTNLSALEQAPEKPAPTVSLFDEPAKEKQRL